MYTNFNIKTTLKQIILSTKGLQDTYNKIYPNTKYTLDQIIDDIIYILKTGVSWRNIRSSIKCKSLYWHYSRFVKHNIFLKLYNLFRKQYLSNYVHPKNTTISLLLDSSVIYNKFGVTKLGRNKFYKNKKCMKISLLTDINGCPLSIFLIKGNYHDNSTFDKHIKDINILLPKNKCKLIADKGYTCKKIYNTLDKYKIEHIIPPKRNMKLYDTYKYSKDEYKKRIKIEHIFARLKMMRRIECRYDKFMPNYKGFLYLGLTFVIFGIVNKL